MRAITRPPLWSGEGAGAVEAGLARPGRGGRRLELAVGAVLELGEDPGRGRQVVLVVLDGAVLDLDAEAGEEVVEVVAVLRLLGLAERRSGRRRRARTPRSRRARRSERRGARALVVASHFGSEGWAMTRTSAPASVSRVSGRSAFGGDVEVAVGERLGGDGVGGVLRVGGLHLLGELAADRPRLGVGLVEEDAGDLRLRGHDSERYGLRGVDASMPIQWRIRAIIRTNGCPGSQDSCAAGGGRAAHLRRHRRRVSLSAPSVKRRVDRLRRAGRAGGVHGGRRPRGDGLEHRGAGRALLPAGDDARRGGGDAARAPRGGRRRGASPGRRMRSPGCGPRTTPRSSG